MLRTLLLVLSACLSCTPSPPIAPMPSDSAYCGAAGAQLLKLQCTDGEGHLLGGQNASGQTYTVRCQTAESYGIPMAPECISNITSCDQVDTCLQDP